MKYFVNIQSVLKDKEKRTLDSLKDVYKDKLRLFELVQSLVQDYLPVNKVINKRIFLKPNWVTHDKKEDDTWCMRAKDEFLLAVLETVLLMKPKSIIIGDAPIQGCSWNKLISKDLLDDVKKLSNYYNVSIKIKDFRRRTFSPSENNPLKEINPLSEYTIFDLGKNSFLEPITSKNKSNFRVTNYDPDRLAESHSAGIHKYCLTNALFDSDVIISIPKIKTHQKTGVTAALKNIVGLNGDKDYLPHHRVGGTGFGGDCYPGKNYLRYYAELILDYANRRQGSLGYWLGFKLSSLLWKMSRPGKEHRKGAGWYGNDTTWRMVLDLNKIAIYGSKDGLINENPQRELYSLCDGIIGGQGNGPLNPDPLELGVISFTNHSGFNDVALATLMRLDINKIPMLNSVNEMSKQDNIELFWNGIRTEISDLEKYSVKTNLPPGWEGYLSEL